MPTKLRHEQPPGLAAAGRSARILLCTKSERETAIQVVNQIRLSRRQSSPADRLSFRPSPSETLISHSEAQTHLPNPKALADQRFGDRQRDGYVRIHLQADQWCDRTPYFFIGPISLT